MTCKINYFRTINGEFINYTEETTDKKELLDTLDFISKHKGYILKDIYKQNDKGELKRYEC